MNATHTLNQVQVRRQNLPSSRIINGVEVKQVWTMFHYDEQKLLCFQILLDLKGGETVSFQKLKDYSTYKKVLNDLHVARSENALITIPEKTNNYN